MEKNKSQTTNSPITLEEFTKVVKWYEYSQNFKKVICSNMKDSIEYEYYFVDCNWINNFKNTFHYERIKRKMEFLKNKGNISTLNEEQIKSLLNQFCKDQCLISENDRKKIKINPNNNIIQKAEIFNKKYRFNNFYIFFVLLDKNIYEELKKSYVFGENIKYNVSIGNSLFIIKLNGTDIEIGEFESVYKYKSIYLLRFSDEDELAREIKLIKNDGIKKYISNYKIDNDNIIQVIKKNNGKEIIIINLLNHLINPNKVINNNLNNKIHEEITITPKRHLNIFNGKRSQLNSVIQLITPIKELKDYLSQYKEFIEENKHIYILSSFFLKIFEQLYGKNKDNNGEDPLKQLEIVINFLAQGIDIKPIDNYLHFILNTLHEELNVSQKQKTETINLISYESPLGQENETLETFKNYYIEYYQSIISNKINWIRKKYFICDCNNNNYLCNFKSFPSLIFDLDATHDYTIKQLTEFKNIINQYSRSQNLLNKKMNDFMRGKLGVPIDITDCFKYYLAKETSSNMTCNFCNRTYKNRYFFHITPNYFIIILNRNPGINAIKIHLSEELNLENFLDNSNEHKKYQLIGLLINDKSNEEEKHFYSVIKNSNYWIQFKDEQITHINDKKKFFSSSDCEKNSKILLYKSMKY